MPGYSGAQWAGGAGWAANGAGGVELGADLVRGDVVVRRLEAVLRVRVRLPRLRVGRGRELRGPEALPHRHVGRDGVREVDVLGLLEHRRIGLPQVDRRLAARGRGGRALADADGVRA